MTRLARFKGVTPVKMVRHVPDHMIQSVERAYFIEKAFVSPMPEGPAFTYDGVVTPDGRTWVAYKNRDRVHQVQPAQAKHLEALGDGNLGNILRGLPAA